MNVRTFITGCCLCLVWSCTTGHLTIVTPEGETRNICETEYAGDPSVDRHAVDYFLAYCAKRAVEKGYRVVDTRLLDFDMTVPNPPKGTEWSFELAQEMHQQGRLTDKEFGYLVAHIDLGLHKK